MYDKIAVLLIMLSVCVLKINNCTGCIISCTRVHNYCCTYFYRYKPDACNKLNEMFTYCILLHYILHQPVIRAMD